MENFDTALNNWIERAQQIIIDDHKKHGFTIPYTVLSIDPGGIKFIRIVATYHNNRSVHCFIERSTGNVLKAASWKAPAKHARGNIFQVGREGVGAYGANYLR